MPDAISQGRTLDELIHMVQDAKAALEGDLEPVIATFSRGLDDDFVEALNREYAEDGWWRTFVDDPELFVAIRDNRVNVYWRGCSLAEVRLEAGEVVGRTHYKYLLRPSMDAPYVEFTEGAYRMPGNTQGLFVGSPGGVRELKRAARPFAGGEKTGVHRIILSNPNILDVEIAFGLPGTEESAPPPRAWTLRRCRSWTPAGWLSSTKPNASPTTRRCGRSSGGHQRRSSRSTDTPGFYGTTTQKNRGELRSGLPQPS